MYSDFSWYRVGIPIQGLSMIERQHDFISNSVCKLRSRLPVRRNRLADNHINPPALYMIRLWNENRARPADGYRNHLSVASGCQHECAALEGLDNSIAARSTLRKDHDRAALTNRIGRLT